MVSGLVIAASGCSADADESDAQTGESEAELRLASCSGSPSMPQTGDLAFTNGTRRAYVRTCDAFGKCSAWKREGVIEKVTVRDLPPGVGDDATLYTTGDVFIARARIGETTTSRQGSSTYVCTRFEHGTATLDPETGIGTGRLRFDETCDVAGGSGGPADTGEWRNVSLKLGSRCLALTDDAPATRFGTQRRAVTTLSW